MSRLVVISNRVGMPDAEGRPAPGGLAVAVAATLREREGLWFGWSGQVAEVPAEPTTMRAAPSARAHLVQDIPAHAQIDLRDCGEHWCAASWRDLDGFVRVEAIAPNDAPLAGPPGPSYVGPPVVVAPVFGWGWGGGYYHRHYW